MDSQIKRGLVLTPTAVFLLLSVSLVFGALTLAPPLAQAAFPGSNGKILFGSITSPSFPNEDLFDVETIYPDGSGRLNLTGNEPVSLNPRWSPDGKKIAYATRVGGDYEIYAMNADGSAKTNLTNSATHDISPAWSPDGTRIAFSRDFDIYVMHADGSKLVGLTNDPRLDEDPIWSPDGSKIAFARGGGDGSIAQIYTMNADGSDETNISNSAVFEQHPDWSPDGTRLVFSIGCRLWTMNADGSGRTELLTGSLGSGGTWPAWSPDGTKIAFTICGLGTSTDIGTVNLDGTGATDVTDNPGTNEYRPDWQAVLYSPPVCFGGPPLVLGTAKQFELVTLGGETDVNGDPVDVTITSVTQDEPVTGPRDHTSPDAVPGPQANAVYLRTERDPRGDGRVYRVGFSATERSGRSCTGTKTIVVPRGQLPAIDSAPPSFNSFEQ